jgi:sterol desaturase/sphingolipid hydroxylase (fatty acid hydroxylase superfamily)
MVNLVARHAVSVLLPLSVARPVMRWAWEHRLGTVSVDTWWAALLLFIGQEFCYYWYHRASHSRPHCAPVCSAS